MTRNLLSPSAGIVLFWSRFSPLLIGYTDMPWSEAVIEQFSIVHRFTTEEVEIGYRVLLHKL
jgi:hypothetical protein